MYSRLLFLLAILALLPSVAFSSYNNVSQEHNVTAYFFWGSGCPHCFSEDIFLNRMKAKYPSLLVIEYETYHQSQSAALLDSFNSAYGISGFGVPRLFIGKEAIIGYDADETTGVRVENAVRNCVLNGCVDAADIVANKTNVTMQDILVQIPESVNIPFFGELSIKGAPLPFIAIVFGLLDGFNPCAMWVLTYLISLFLTQKDRRRMLWVVGVFLLASGFVYYLIMAAWLNVFQFIGYMDITRIIVGLLALGAGLFQLKEFFTMPEFVCKVTNPASRAGIVKRIQEFATPGALPATLLGVVTLAITVNLIEFVCSSGFPVIFTRILTLSELPWWLYHAYILLYVLMYMLDDLIIFAVAVATLSSLQESAKYARYCGFVGGLLLVILGLLLLFVPSALMV